MRKGSANRLALPRRGWCRRLPGLSLEERDWLTHVDSLTARIKALSPDVRVRLCYEGVGRAKPDERHILQSRVVYVREVELIALGCPVVRARTTLSLGALTGPWRFLSTLGSRPLGERLFADRGMKRSPFVFCWQRRQKERVPARLARICRKGHPIVLKETLLPKLFALSGS